LVALAPFCTRRRWGIRITEFLGSEERDLGSILTAPGDEALGAGAVRLALERHDWDFVDLWGVPDGSPSADALEEGLAAANVRYERLRMSGNPVLDISTDAWDATASRSRLRRLAPKRRALERLGKLELTFPRKAEELEAALVELRALHHKRWKRSGETTRLQFPDYWRWVRGITGTAQREGWLYFPRLMLDGRPIATGIYFLYGRRLFFWVGAHDPDFARHSPFQLLTLSVIGDVRSAGTADVLDFGAGDESYKYHWTQTSLQRLRVMAWRGSRGRAAHFWQGRIRPWAWAHQDITRPMRRWRRIRSLLVGGGPSPANGPQDDAGMPR